MLSGDNLRYVKDRVEEVRKERLIKYYARGRMEEIEIMDRRSFGGSSTKTVRKAHAVAPKLNISEISLKKN